MGGDGGGRVHARGLGHAEPGGHRRGDDPRVDPAVRARPRPRRPVPAASSRRGGERQPRLAGAARAGEREQAAAREGARHLAKLRRPGPQAVSAARGAVLWSAPPCVCASAPRLAVAACGHVLKESLTKPIKHGTATNSGASALLNQMLGIRFARRVPLPIPRSIPRCFRPSLNPLALLEFVSAHGGTVQLVDGQFPGAHFLITTPIRAIGGDRPAPVPSSKAHAHAA